MEESYMVSRIHMTLEGSRRLGCVLIPRAGETLVRYSTGAEALKMKTTRSKQTGLRPGANLLSSFPHA